MYNPLMEGYFFKRLSAGKQSHFHCLSIDCRLPNGQTGHYSQFYMAQNTGSTLIAVLYNRVKSESEGIGTKSIFTCLPVHAVT